MTHAIKAPPRPEHPRLGMTYEEWLAWPDGQSTQSEWVDGEVVVFMPPSGLHQDIVLFFGHVLGVYVRALGLGIVRLAPFEMRLTPGGSREPDLLFVAREHEDRLTPQRLVGAADLAVEVVSDDSVRRDRLEKFAAYALAGVPEYWLLDPRPGRRREDVFVLSDEGVYDPLPLDAEGRYRSTVVPGFWFRPAWLRAAPLPDPLGCLREIAPDLLAAPGVARPTPNPSR